MPTYEQQVYAFMLDNVRLQIQTPWTSFSRRIRFSDGTELPFRELPDGVMDRLELLATKVPNEEIYTVTR